MTAFWTEADYDDHELVEVVRDAKSGLTAIIALHSTHLGPAAGGARFWNYSDDAKALTDALRLSRGMSYKNAMAGLPLGGGKSVILADENKSKSPELLAAFGRAVIAVVVGLAVYLLLSRSGPLGAWGILFTPQAMVIAQTILVAPIIAALARQTVEDLWLEYRDELAALETLDNGKSLRRAGPVLADQLLAAAVQDEPESQGDQDRVVKLARNGDEVRDQVDRQRQIAEHQDK